MLGSVLAHADGSFNTILELGFASSIRKEWEWRNLRGESTRNLEAFRGWLETDATPGRRDGPSLAGVEWPFFDLRIVCGEVLLRGADDADLEVLQSVVPDDLEMNPANERFATLSPEADKRRQLVGEMWKHRGDAALGHRVQRDEAEAGRLRRVPRVVLGAPLEAASSAGSTKS